MKSIQFYFYASFAVMMLLQAGACKKAEQALLQDPCSDIKFCNIKSFSYPGSGTSFPPNVATFTYDVYGNPLTVTNTVVGTGSPNLIFRYDAAHRLTEFIRPYANGIFEQWIKYVYDASGRIVHDTTFLFGTVTPTQPINYVQASITTYTYDNTCRIIKTSSVVIQGDNGEGFPPIVTNYVYDANSNLIRPGITYDNKVNIHRTNKIFMFVDRDYSLNNPYTAPAYNTYGLPKIVGMSTPGAPIYFLSRTVENASFTYQCD